MKRTVKRIIYNIIVFSLLAIGIIIVCYRFLHLGNVEYTDNAVVCQHITPVNTRVAGFIKEIRFEENQVEQRLPIRISLKGNSAQALALLRAGYNVECEVEKICRK